MMGRLEGRAAAITGGAGGIGLAAAQAFVREGARVMLVDLDEAAGGPLGIRVNTVNPAPIETRMMRSLEAGFAPDAPTRTKKNIATRIPLKRYGTPNEVADLMLFLASDESRYCTGGVYSVDGSSSAG